MSFGTEVTCVVSAPVTAKRDVPADIAAGGFSIIRGKLRNTLLQLVAYPPIAFHCSGKLHSSGRFASRSERTLITQVNHHHRAIYMSAIDNETSILANIQIQLIQNVMLSRYFTAAGVVVVLYDTILTIEDEVSGIHTQKFELHSLSTGSPSLARAFRSFEATLLHQPVLDDCVLDSCQLPWVTHTPDALPRTYTAQVVAGFRPPLSNTVSASPFFGHGASFSDIPTVVGCPPQHLLSHTK